MSMIVILGGDFFSEKSKVAGFFCRGQESKYF